MSLIRVHRGGGFADRWRAYKICVDGDEAGKISAKSVLDIAVTPGSHSLVAKIDWTRSEEIEVHVGEKETIHLDVANTYGATRSVCAISVGRNSYLSLTPRAGT